MRNGGGGGGGGGGSGGGELQSFIGYACTSVKWGGESKIWRRITGVPRCLQRQKQETIFSIAEAIIWLTGVGLKELCINANAFTRKISMWDNLSFFRVITNMF